MNDATPGPWYWMGDNTLVGGHGKRPVIITAGRTDDADRPQMLERDPESGLLVPLKIDGPNARLIASAPALRDALVEVEEFYRLVMPAKMLRKVLDALASSKVPA